MNFEENAAILQSHVHSGGYAAAAPKGFTHVGSGASRSAYAMDGFVYKVCRSGGFYGDENQNVREFENYIDILDNERPEWVKIPVTDLVMVPCNCTQCNGKEQGVTIMEHIVGDQHNWSSTDEAYKKMYEEFYKSFPGFHDLMGPNIVVNKDGWWAIDLQM